MHRNLSRNVSPELDALPRAWKRSIEAEARLKLNNSLTERPEAEIHWADAMLALFGPKAGVELALPARDMAREIPDFDALFVD